jgi:hypothetical protein
MRGNVAAIVLVVLGCFFLANNLGWIDLSLWQLIRVWWPLILIVVGVSLLLSPREKISSGTGASAKDST